MTSVLGQFNISCHVLWNEAKAIFKLVDCHRSPLGRLKILSLNWLVKYGYYVLNTKTKIFRKFFYIQVVEICVLFCFRITYAYQTFHGIAGSETKPAFLHDPHSLLLPTFPCNSSIFCFRQGHIKIWFIGLARKWFQFTH